MSLTQLTTSSIADDAVTEDKIANAINTARAANTAKDLTALSAANLTSGTIPDARFPATLPAVSAANLTNVPARTNLIANGAMRVAQRKTSHSTNNGGYHTVDRFKYLHGGNDNPLTQSQADVAAGTTPYTLGFRKSYKLTNGDQTSGAGTNDNVHLQTTLEAQDLANSGWNYTSASSYITLSFWVKSSVAQNFYGYLRTRDGTEQRYAFETGSLSANTWTKITKTIAGNSNLQFDNDADKGLNIHIVPFFGTAFTDSGVSLNTWGAYASDTRMPDNTSTWYTTNNATFEITGVQLEVGSSASPFAHEPIADTLRKCQRYLYILDLGTDSNVLNFQLHRYSYNTGAPLQYITWPVVMRGAPSMTKDGTSYAGGGYQTSITLASALTTAGVVIGDTATAAGLSSYHRPNTSSGSSLRYLFSAEL